jgi:pyridoxal phosphate enzyme (YggS family)
VTDAVDVFPGFDERLTGIRARIGAASPDPSAVTLMAVTKGFGPEAVRTALAAGLTVVGENYADELVAKAHALADDPGPVPEWHFLGAIQRNKVARLAPVVACWQGVTRLAEGRAIATRRPGARVLVQVDVAGLPGRGGVPPGEVAELVTALRGEDLDVAGLMAVGPPGPPEGARAGFREVRRLADDLDLSVRSMGMTDDLEVALSEGSTMIRVGRALFGDRPRRV